MNEFWTIAGYFFWIFVFVAYLSALFGVVVDLFRDHQLAGGFKALWILFLVFVPILAVLVYLIARGRGMADRSAGRVPQMTETQDEEARAASVSTTPASDIASAKALLDQGIINVGEFDALKSKAISGRF
jgi:hypothetical protein